MKTELVFASLAGSHLYGTNRPDSDLDVRGVCFSPEISLLGLSNFEQYMPSKENSVVYSKEKFGVESDDLTIYALNKFFKLCLGSNPNIIELLFSQKVLYTSPTWEEIQKNRHLFLSTMAIESFAGYAYSQLKRIESHKKWLDNPPQKPSPFDYGMTTNIKGGQVWSDNNLKNKYSHLLKKHQHYSKWLKNRNPSRAKLEKLYGYDTKHASHLYRLFFEAEELLTEGKITLPLKDSVLNRVLDVLRGKVSYEEVVTLANEIKNKLLAINSVLPNKPDRKGAENLLIKLQRKNLLKQESEK